MQGIIVTLISLCCSFFIYAQFAQAYFTDVSEITGVSLISRSQDPIWGDFDNDGNLDIFVGNHREPPSLYWNDGNGHFIDIRSTAGIPPGEDRHGAAWGDYDNDGDLDLYISIGGWKGLKPGNGELYRNEGNGVFTNIADIAGVKNSDGRGQTASWADYDNDGDLDLFVGNNVVHSKLYRNNNDGTFTDVALSAGLISKFAHKCSWADYDNDGDEDIFCTGEADILYRNNGDGTFTNTSKLAGMKAFGSGTGVAWGDYDNDGDLDLYVARGYDDIRNELFWDSSKVIFYDMERLEEDGLDFITTGSTISFLLYQDYLSDVSIRTKYIFIGSSKINPSSIPFTLDKNDPNVLGKPTYTVGQDAGYFIWLDETGKWHIRWSGDDTISRIFYGTITTDGIFTEVTPVKFDKITPYIRNTLYRNNGDGTFSIVTGMANVGSGSNDRAAIWGDYDNDGDLDLYVVNSGSSLFGNGPNKLFRNNNDGTFTNVATQEGVKAKVSGRGDGTAWGDYDNDGDLDLFITNGFGLSATKRLQKGPHILFRNEENGNNWVKIKLIGQVSNKQGLGSKIIVKSGSMTQFREFNEGGGGQFHSQGATPIHFGLGTGTKIDSLTIKWPSGVITTLHDISVNQMLTIIEE